MTAGGPAPELGRAGGDGGDGGEARVWTDRRGRAHRERARGFTAAEGDVPASRLRGPVERDWEAAGTADERRLVLDDALAGPSPKIAPDPDDPARVLMTWTVRAPRATSVLLEANGLVASGGADALEMTRLAGTEVWTCTWSVPEDWSASYGFAIWKDESVPPWRAMSGRSARLAAMLAAEPDPRASRTIGSSFGAPRSVASATSAPAPPWEGLARPRRCGRVHEFAVPEFAVPLPAPSAPSALPAPTALAAPSTEADSRSGDPARSGWAADATGAPSAPPATGAAGAADAPGAAGSGGGSESSENSERVWVYEPAHAPAAGPVLILFDGQVWLEQMGIVPVLDALIDSGLLPPVHVAMIDSRDQGEYRAEHVGVPGGHVDLVIDRILPLLRSRFAVSPHGADTIVSGQSYGGIASLWALALADGEIGHAIAQSPSLWRFDVAEALAACPHWLTARILSGTFEGPMLMHARDLARALSGRDVRVTPVSGGHDWAWWSVRLLIELADLLHARPNSRSDVGRES